MQLSESKTKLNDWIFSAFNINKCIFFLPPHFDLHQWSQSMGLREVLSGGNYEGLTGDFPWSQIFNFLTFKSHWQYMQESMRVVCVSLIYLNRFSTIWMFEVNIYIYIFTFLEINKFIQYRCTKLFNSYSKDFWSFYSSKNLEKPWRLE